MRMHMFYVFYIFFFQINCSYKMEWHTAAWAGRSRAGRRVEPPAAQAQARAQDGGGQRVEPPRSQWGACRAGGHGLRQGRGGEGQRRRTGGFGVGRRRPAVVGSAGWTGNVWSRSRYCDACCSPVAFLVLVGCHMYVMPYLKF